MATDVKYCGSTDCENNLEGACKLESVTLDETGECEDFAAN